MLDTQVSATCSVALLACGMSQISENICLGCSRDQRAKVSGACPRLLAQLYEDMAVGSDGSIMPSGTVLDPSVGQPRCQRTDKAAGICTVGLLQLLSCMKSRLPH
jgi:hypothetical protein